MGKPPAFRLPVGAVLLVAACAGDQSGSSHGRSRPLPDAGSGGSSLDAAAGGSSGGGSAADGGATGAHTGGHAPGSVIDGGGAATGGGRAGAAAAGTGAAGAGAGGSSASGGRPGVSGGGAAGASSGGRSGAPGGGAGGAGGAAGGAGASGGSSATCGSEPCASTRCAAWNCGAAVCCTIGTGLTCVHGTGQCPAPDTGEKDGLLECWGSPLAAYVFDKSCTQKSDCFVADHYRGCCNVHAVGLNASEQSRFDSFERSCGGAPPCGCCCDRVTAEDGQTVASGTALDVDCVGGVCTSRLP